MADFLLTVGVDTGLSFSQMQADISGLVSRLNANPPKIKVGLQLDDAAKSSIQKEIENLFSASTTAAKAKASTGSAGASTTSAQASRETAKNMADVAARTREAASATKSMDAGFKSSNSQTKILAKDTKEYYAALKQLKTLLADINHKQSTWTAARNGKSKDSYESLGLYAERVSQLYNEVSAGNMSKVDFDKQFKSISAGATEAATSIKAAGENTRSWGERIGALSAKFGTWFSITRVIMAGYRAVKQMVSNVVELDTAMTELKKVTDLTETAYDNIFDKAVTRAKDLGATVTDTITATADFSRLGYNIYDAEQLADAAIIYKNVGDGITDISAASESVISTMKAFGIEAADSMSIVDKFNEVGNNFAISSKGIGDALQRSASALAAAGNDIDESIAMAVGMNAVVQDPEKVGNVLKTSSMYLRAAKTEAEDAGEATDGMANSVSELRDELLTLTKGRVDIMQDDSTFKSTIQIYRELAAVWDDLADIDTANILELIGGKRNSTAIASLLTNFDEVEKALKTSQDSAGSATEENLKQLDSIEGRLRVFKATFQELSHTMFPSEAIKGFINAGTGLLSFINSAVTALGGLGNALTVVGLAIAALNFQKTVAMFTSLCNVIKSGFGIIPKVVSLVNNLKAAWSMGAEAGGGFISTLKGAASALIGTSSAASIATVAIMGVVAVIAIAVMAYQNWKRHIEEQRKAAIEAGDAATAEAQKITEAYSAYHQASTALEANTGSKEALASATTTLLAALGVEETQLQSLVSKYGDLDAAIRQVTIDSLNTKLQEMTAGYEASKETLLDKTKDGWFTSFSLLNFGHDKDSIKFANALKDSGLIDSSSYGSGGGSIYLGDNSSLEGVIEMYQKLIDMRAKLDEGVSTGKYTRDELSESELYKSINNKLTSFSGEYDSVLKYIDDINDTAAQLQYFDLSESMGVPKTKEEFEALKNNMIATAKESGQFVGTQEQIEASVLRTMSQLPELSAFKEEITNSLSDLGVTTLSIPVKIETEKTGIENMMNAVKESISATGMTDETIENITARYKDLAAYNPDTLFEKTANGIHLNVKALRELESAYEAERKANINKSLDERIKSYNELSEKINNSADASERADLLTKQEGLESQINQIATLAAQYEGLTSAYQQWIDAQSMGEEGDMYDNLTNGLKQAQELYDKGLYGTNEFQAAAQLMTNYDLSNDGIEDIVKAYENGYPLMKRYFTEGREGCENFLRDVESLGEGWAQFNKETGEWELDFGKGNDKAVADKLGISVDAVQSVLRKLSDYGFEIELDSVFDNLDLVDDKITQAAEHLKEIGATDIDFDFNSDDVNNVRSQIEEAKKVLDSLRSEDGTLNLDDSDVQDAQLVLSALIAQLQQLENPPVMHVDTSNATSEVEQALALLQQFQTALNEQSIQAQIGADTSEADTKVQSLTTEIQNLSPEIKASLGLNTDSAATIQTSIQAITPAIMVKAGIDPTLVDEYCATEKTASGKVVWTNDPTLVDAYAATTKTATGTVNWGNNTNNVKTSFTATGTVNWKDGAGARGTAFAKGSWGTKKSGVALGGELGQELIVRDGKFFTIGDDGAEFFAYKKDDIIFNAEQTKQIFEKGKITTGNRRGKALAEGTAFSRGSGKFHISSSSGSSPTPKEKYTAENTIKASAEVKVEDVSVDSESLDESMEDALKAMEDQINEALEIYEHQIFILEKTGGSDAEIIAIYQRMQEEIHNQAEAYRAQGLDENSKYIRDMQKQWWDCQDEISDIISEGYEHDRDIIENSADLMKIYLERAIAGNDSDAITTNVTGILDAYKQMQDSVHSQAEYYRSLGYSDTSDEVSELSELWWEYQEEMVDAVTEAYDGVRKQAENSISLIQLSIDDAMSKGDFTTASARATEIVAINRKMQEDIRAQAEYYRSLGYSDTSDEVSELSELWWEYEENISEAMSNVYEVLEEKAKDTLDNIRKLFDTLQQGADEFANEGSITIDTLTAIGEIGLEYLPYLKDENGLLVINRKRIEDTIAAKTRQYAVDMAMSYVEQIRAALLQNDAAALERLTNATDLASDSTWGLVYANLALLDLSDEQYATAFDNVNKFRDLSEDALLSIGRDSDDTLESANESLESIIDLVMELIEYETEEHIEALEEQIDKYQKIIDLKKESLQATKEENDYNKDVAEKVKEIAELQSRVDQLSLDDSREAQAEKKSLEEELAELQTDLADYQADYSLDKQLDMLDDEAEAYEEAKQKEITAAEESISSTEKLYRLAVERITTAWEDDWNGLFTDIINWNYEAGSTIESEIVEKWDKATTALEKYGLTLNSIGKLELTSPNNSSSSSSGSSSKVNNTVSKSDTYTDIRPITQKMKQNSKDWMIASDAKQKELADANQKLASKLISLTGESISRKDGTWYWDETGKALYTIDTWEAVDYIVKAMRSNSNKWGSASASQRAELEKLNTRMAEYIKKITGQDVRKDGDGVWWIGNDKLYEAYGTYHTGGIVGDKGSFKDNEVLTLLEEGELVLDQHKKDSLYEYIDAATYMLEKFGVAVDAVSGIVSSSPKMLINGIEEMNKESANKLSAIKDKNISYNIESFEVTAPIQVLQKLDDDAIRKYSRKIGAMSVDYIQEGFTKRGIAP